MNIFNQRCYSNLDNMNKQTQLLQEDLKKIGRGEHKYFTYKTYTCEIVRSARCLCGYVHLPKGHPLLEAYHTEIDIEVHGGLTYSDEGKIGFDCGHFDDYLFIWMPIGENKDCNFVPCGAPSGEYKNYEYVVKELENLVDKIINKEYEILDE